MKKKITYCLIIFLAFTSCKKDDPAKAKVTKKQEIHLGWNKIKKRGKINALINNSSTSYFIYKGQAMGFEYELLKKFAKHENLGLNVVIIKNMDSALAGLNEDKGDIVAANLSVTKDRSKKAAFTHYNIITRQVLVQRKPPNWRQIRAYGAKNTLIRSPLDLVGKKIYVRKNSSFYHRLKHLSDEIGGKIDIETVPGDITTEDLIKEVSQGYINYTIADENVAHANAAYYKNIDINTNVSFKQKIAWAVRKSDTLLLSKINTWLDKYKKTAQFRVVYNKYFKNRTGYVRRVSSVYYAARSGRLSPYDGLIKKYAKKLGWDWRLLAAVIYQESHFDNDAESWTGASGLMQIMPATAEILGIDSNATPEQNIAAGTKMLKNIDEKWAKTIKNKSERIKFDLASYNVGLGHVIDARNLTIKYGQNPVKWEHNVAYFLLYLSQPKFYNDDIVKSGYCRGSEPYDYVKEILIHYKHYKNILSTREDLAEK